MYTHGIKKMDLCMNFDKTKSFWIGNDLDYYIIPKNGCSSVRHMMLQTIKDVPDLNDYYDSDYNIINFKTKLFQYYNPVRSKAVKFAVKRNPIDRFISAYSDIVLFRKKENLSIEEILQGNYKDKHFNTQTYFAGSADTYDHIFDVTEMNKVAELISDYTNINIRVQHIRKTKNKIRLHHSQIRMVEEFYKEDYKNGWH